MSTRFSEYRDSRLWHALTVALAELEANRELQLATAPEYVVELLCQELVARGLVTEDALAPRDGRG